MAFLMAFAIAPGVAAYRNAAFEVLNVMGGYRTLPVGVMAGLAGAVCDPKLDIQPLSLVVRNLIESDARLPELNKMLAGDGAAIEKALPGAAWLLTDPLLTAVLARAVNIGAQIEGVFTVLRRHLCDCVAHKLDTILLTDFRDVTTAMVRQCITNRFAWAETAQEGEIVATLKTRSDENAVLVRAAYRPLSEIERSHAETLPAPIAVLWREEADERRRAAALPELTPLTPGLSAAMRTQYEAYPYPRWRQVHVDGRLSLRGLLGQTMPHVPFDAALDGNVDVLVAGCGTGRPALTLALALANARVLAVDISRTSLAYAARMAAELQTENISFGVADILNLGAMSQKFDFIDCSGVLHHMADPAAGLRVLRGMLRPHGVMMVGLYSERGRHNEVAAQRFVQDFGFADTPDGLRAARATLLALPAGDAARAVVDTLDFYTLDGLHDLVFNVHESRTSPAAIKRLLATCDLAAIGVNVRPALGGSAFRAAHPDPAAWADLDLWEAFEERHPQVFAHMIQVWCRPTEEKP